VIPIDSKEFSISQTNEKCTYIVKLVVSEFEISKHDGKFTLQAKNALGECLSSIQVNVKPNPNRKKAKPKKEPEPEVQPTEVKQELVESVMTEEKPTEIAEHKTTNLSTELIPPSTIATTTEIVESTITFPIEPASPATILDGTTSPFSKPLVASPAISQSPIVSPPTSPKFSTHVNDIFFYSVNIHSEMFCFSVLFSDRFEIFCQIFLFKGFYHLSREFAADDNNTLREGDMVFISKIVDNTCHVEMPDGSSITLPSSELFSKQQYEELINDKVNLAFSKVLKGKKK
jgi:hypothetical protein